MKSASRLSTMKKIAKEKTGICTVGTSAGSSHQMAAGAAAI
jgi:hypothetical protein